MTVWSLGRVASTFCVVGLMGCGDDSKLPVGETCGASNECASGLCLMNECLDPNGDEDGDGIINGLEGSLSSNPRDVDTDGDGVTDSDELGPDLEAIDGDGDGVADILESLVEDDDGDCVVNQRDATNDTADNRDSGAIGRLCPTAGVCGANGAVLTIVCPDGPVSERCELSGVTGHQVVESGCDGVDNNCDSQVDEGLTCEEPVRATYVVLNPYWALEDDIFSASLIPGHRVLANMTFNDTGFGFTEECVVDGIVQSNDGQTSGLTTVSRCLVEDVDVPATIVGGSVTVTTPGGTFENPLGFTETELPQTIVFSTVYGGTEAPDGADLLIGQNVREYSIATGDGLATVGKEMNLFVVVRESEVSPQAVVGDWGLIGLLVDVDAPNAQIEYDIGAFAGNLAQGAAPGSAAFDVVASLEGYVEQGFNGPNDSRLFVGESEFMSEPPFPLTFGAGGEVRIDGGDQVFVGAVAPRGDFMMLVATTPEVGSARGSAEPVYDYEPTAYAHQVLIGVKRVQPTTGLLAGKRYRLYRQELGAEVGAFGMTEARGTLVFDAAGTGVTLSGDLERHTMPFAGDPVYEPVEGASLTLRVLVDETPFLRMAEVDAPAGDFATVGFVQAGGRVLVLGDFDSEVNEVGATTKGAVGMMIGVCTNCDAADAP